MVVPHKLCDFQIGFFYKAVPNSIRFQNTMGVRSKNNEMRRYIGNNMDLNLNGRKKRDFLVVGNDCCISLEENLSSVKVIGDNCRVQVLSGKGKILYVGNNGSIFLQKDVSANVVNYIGNDGKILKNGVEKQCNSEKVIRIDKKSNCTVSRTQSPSVISFSNKSN